MKLKIADTGLFKAVFKCITKFVEKAHFEVLESGIRIRSIDPHDFCYVDLTLLPNFFEKYDLFEEFGFCLDVSKLSRILPNLISARSIFLGINQGDIRFQTVGEWITTFKLNWLEDNPYYLPEPMEFRYSTHVDLSAKQFSDLIKKASAIANEICFSVKNGKVAVNASSGNCSFEAESLASRRINSVGKPVSVCTISNYLKLLDPLISKCENVRISLDENLPLRIYLSYPNKGNFSFFVSHQKIKTKRKERTDRGGTSLPRISVSRFPDFLAYLSSCPEGVENEFLVMAQLETKGSDYSRLASMLGFIMREKRKIKLTPEGKKFVSMYMNKIDLAKQQLHMISLKKILAYKLMIQKLMKKSMSINEIHESVNASLKRRGLPEIDKQDISTLLGLATWCGYIDRKLALYYFGR